MHSPRIAIAAVLLGLVACQKTEAPRPAAAATSKEPAPKTAAAPAVPEAVKKVLGKWVRPDGGYVLELRNPDLSGVLEAAYFNPRSIRVSRAAWMQGGAGLQVMVELNDVDYPGATYVLTYDPQADRLAGQYTQPRMQQTFDIEFIRQTTP